MMPHRSINHFQLIVRLLIYVQLVCIHVAYAGSHAAQGATSQRSLKQDFAQFSPLLDTRSQFGGWGGQWVLTPATPSLMDLLTTPSPSGSSQNGNGAMRPTTVRSASNRRPIQVGRGTAPATSSSAAVGRNPPSSSLSSGNREMGQPGGAVTVIRAPATASTNRGAPGSFAATGSAAAGAVGAAVGAGSAQTAAGLPANVNVGINVADTDTSAALSRTAGIVNGRDPPRITNPAVIRTLPRFNAQTGQFVAGSNVALWPSINPGSRVDAVFLPDANTTSNAGNATANATSTLPPADSVTVLDPDPVNTTTVPAASFESGYCVPRQAYLVVNVTSLACAPGSNLTRWDNEPVCAKLDCSWRARGTNVINTATGCRTVVERAKPICPRGCVVIEQLKWNATVNRTQLFTKCSCRAGNQPCPSQWTGCTCYEGLNSRNLTRGFVVCSETQGECDRKCNLAVSGNPRLAPLCPIAMDPFLSIKPAGAPIYPMFGWNINSQARQTAMLAAAGRSLKQLAGLGRRLTMAAADWQLHRVVAGDQAAAAAPFEPGVGAGTLPWPQRWLTAGRAWGCVHWARRWLGAWGCR